MKTNTRLHLIKPNPSSQGLWLTVLAGAALFNFLVPASAAPVLVSSPNGTVKAQVSDNGGNLRYSISVDGQPVLAPSAVGIQSDGISYGTGASLGIPKIRQINETYPIFGVKSKAVNRASFATVPVTTNGQPCTLDIHVADDGVGIRLRLPAKPGRKVEADLSTWSLPGNPIVWAAEYEAPYEQTYHGSVLKESGPKSYGLPLTAKVGSTYVTLTEAALKDYGDLAIKEQDNGTLAGYLPNDAQGWITDSEVVQPWRVTIVARDLTALVNTTLVQNLNPPADPSLLNADWITPGVSSWQWLSIGDPKFEDQHQWVDWTHDLSFPYYLVDDGWVRWPDSWASLKSVCDYAKTKGVKIWLWVNSREVAQPEQRAAYFQKAADAGIVGVKVDFPPPTNREWSNWYPDAARDAAAHKLLIDFHGATKPTGMERTWPNELTREGIRGHEYQITRYRRHLESQHDTILPFTRYVVGHGDYTPTVFEPKELQGNTWAHELAQAVVFTSPFLSLGGNPRDYLANPARDLISALPATWDETRVLPGSEPGKIAGMARRHGDQWFIGVLNGADSAALDIPLSFLGGGSWKASYFGDVSDRADAWDHREEKVTAKTSFHAPLSSRGGLVVWLRK